MSASGSFNVSMPSSSGGGQPSDKKVILRLDGKVRVNKKHRNLTFNKRQPGVRIVELPDSTDRPISESSRASVNAIEELARAADNYFNNSLSKLSGSEPREPSSYFASGEDSESDELNRTFDVEDPQNRTYVVEDPQNRTFVVEDPQNRTFDVEYPQNRTFVVEDSAPGLLNRTFVVEDPENRTFVVGDQKNRTFVVEDQQNRTFVVEDQQNRTVVVDDSASKPQNRTFTVERAPDSLGPAITISQKKVRFAKSPPRIINETFTVGSGSATPFNEEDEHRAHHSGKSDRQSQQRTPETPLPYSLEEIEKRYFGGRHDGPSTSQERVSPHRGKASAIKRYFQHSISRISQDGHHVDAEGKQVVVYSSTPLE